MAKVTGMSKREFAKAVLHRIGVQPTDGAVQGMLGWMAAEGGHWNNSAKYNPLNTTQPAPGAGNTGSQGNIKVYTSWRQGVHATAETLRNGNYAPIIHALRQGNPRHVAAAIDASPWGTHGSLVYGAIASAPSHAGGGNYQIPAGRGGAAARYQTQTQTQTVPDTAARDATRRAAALAYLNDSTRPDALLNLALAVNSADQTKTNTTVTRTKTRAPSSDVGRLGASPPPRELRHVKGTDTFEGKTVAAWIVPVLKYARAHGWKGAVNSGYRSYAQQKAIYDSGVRPAAVPGTSNHEGDVFPRGAVDVSNAAQLSTILRGSPYRHLLQYAGAKDPVHFSHPHNGSY